MSRTSPTDNEAIKELRDTMIDLNISTNKSSCVMTVLTVVLVILTIILILQGFKVI